MTETKVYPAQLIAEYPEYSELDNEVIQTELDRTQRLLEPHNWGDDLNEAIILYTAHKFELKYRNQIFLGGAIKSIKEGKGVDTKIDLGGGNSQSSLHLTSSGKLFLELEQSKTGSGLISI